MIRSNRKTLALGISLEGDIIARAPKDMPIVDIESIIDSDELLWFSRVSRALAEYKSIEKYAKLESILLLGREYVVDYAVIDASRISGRTLLIPMNCKNNFNETRFELRDFILKNSFDVLPRAVAAFAEKIGQPKYELKISQNMKNAWGKCDAKGEVTLNSRITMLPPQAMNYVIIHEIVHLFNLNHSKKFWSMLGEHCPDYKRIEELLAGYNFLMRIL